MRICNLCSYCLGRAWKHLKSFVFQLCEGEKEIKTDIPVDRSMKMNPMFSLTYFLGFFLLCQVTTLAMDLRPAWSLFGANISWNYHLGSQEATDVRGLEVKNHKIPWKKLYHISDQPNFFPLCAGNFCTILVLFAFKWYMYIECLHRHIFLEDTCTNIKICRCKALQS